MKQTYVKPVLVMENFTLNQSIAHNCGDSLDWSQATLKYKGSCGWDTDPIRDNGSPVLFTDAIIDCTVDGSGADGVIVCYNNPDGAMNIFNS